MAAYDPFEGPADPFTRFWTDMAAKTPMGVWGTADSDSREQMLRHMRQAFFDSWAKYCEEFLGSEQFLDMMKKSMDGALDFRQKVNDFLTKSMHDAQMPTRTDAESIAHALQSTEQRLTERLEELSRRLDRIEGASRPAGKGPAVSQAPDDTSETRRGPARPHPAKGGSK
jgi:hypothetical protein